MLNQFRRINIIWDGINRRIHGPIDLVVGGGGRVLSVTVSDNGQAINSEDIVLKINWKAPIYSNTDTFEPVDGESGMYQLDPPEQMVRNVGTVRASLELSTEGIEPITSMPFEIHVKEAI